jgi:hypothetical protein
MSEPLTPERADKIRAMRREGFLWPDIAAAVDLPVSVCIAVCERPEWPKVVTRVYRDGAAAVVRDV